MNLSDIGLFFLIWASFTVALTAGSLVAIAILGRHRTTSAKPLDENDVAEAIALANSK